MKKKSLSALIALSLVATSVLPAATTLAATTTTTAPASIYGVTYEGHVQNIGWQTPVTVKGDQADISTVAEAGTDGQSLRVEALKIAGVNLPEGASITYQGHVQNIGWQTPVTSDSTTTIDNAQEVGTHGQSLRVEALKLTLNGMPGYAIKYQGHVQNVGWQTPVVVENGTAIDAAPIAGTTGQGLRVEALKIEIVKTDAEKAAEVTAIDAVAKAQSTESADDVAAAGAAVAAVKDATVKSDLGAKIPSNISNLTLVTTDFNKQIGNTMTIKAKLTNKDGSVAAGKDVKLESGTYDAPNFFEKPMTLTATTDANGIATFTYTRNHEGTENVDLYAADKPIVRSSARVIWTLANPLVTVDNTAPQTLGTGTYVDYGVTFQNADKTPRVATTNRAHIQLTSAATVYYRDLHVTDANAANAWVSLGAGTNFSVLAQPDATQANANIDANGKMQFRIVGTTANQTVTPTFFYNVVGGEADTTIDSTDPRAVGAAISYVAQTPVITLTPADTTNTIATTNAPLGTAAQQAAHSGKAYTLTAKDQFGNPYRGTVDVADYLAVDNVGLSIPTATAATMDIYENPTDTIADGTQALNTTTTAFNFAYDSTLAGTIAANTVLDKNNDGTVKLVVKDNTDKQSLKLAAFADTNPKGTGAGQDVIGQIDSDEASAVADTITFNQRALTKINVAPVAGTETAANGHLDFTATLLDQFGDGVLPGTSLDFEIAKHPSMALETANTNFTVNASNTAATADASYTTDTALAATTQVALGNVDNNVVKLRVTGQGALGTTAGDWELIAYADANGAGGRYNGTQVAGSSVFTVKAPVLTAGTITAAGTGNIVAAGTGYDIVGTTAAANANATTLTYTLQNQSAGTYTNTSGSAVNVTWTIVNNGTKDAQYSTGAGYTTVAAGQTATVTTTVANNASATTLLVDGANNTTDTSTLAVTAQVASTPATAKTVNVLYVPTASQITNAAGVGSFTGTVVGFSKDGDNDSTVANNDGTIVVLKAADGSYATLTLTNADEINTTAAGAVSVDTVSLGNTEDKFENAISLGDTITVTKAAAGLAAGDKISLTNK